MLSCGADHRFRVLQKHGGGQRALETGGMREKEEPESPGGAQWGCGKLGSMVRLGHNRWRHQPEMERNQQGSPKKGLRRIP